MRGIKTGKMSNTAAIRFLILILVAVGCTSARVAMRPRAGAEVEDTYMAPLDIITKYGYPAENHTVQTDDGYLLTLHRIPYGRMCGPERNRGPVLVKHGFLSSSVDWFISGTEKGLPYILADNCYDVWLGNSRGNTFSKAHAWLDVHSPEYWSFSWHEMGVYDVPAEIDYILHKTGWKDLLYVGHSQGTTEFLVFNSVYPEREDKVRAAFLLAPIAYFNHNRNTLLHTIAQYQDAIGWLDSVIGLHEFLPHSDFVSQIGGSLCSKSHPAIQDICRNILFIACGYDSLQLNSTMLPIFLGHSPSGASTLQFLHYVQTVNSGKFRQFDLGKSGNLKKYGQEEPPEYDLSKMTIPTVIHYSSNDLFAAVEDVRKVASEIGSLYEEFLIPYKSFNHLDFIVAVDVVVLLYDHLLSIMDRF